MHQVPVTAGWTEAVWNTKFARHSYTLPTLGIEPRPSDIESNALSAGPHAPIKESLQSSNKLSYSSTQYLFLRVSDMKKHAQMAALTKERDSLKSAIKTYKSLFDMTQQLIDELESKYWGKLSHDTP